MRWPDYRGKSRPQILFSGSFLEQKLCRRFFCARSVLPLKREERLPPRRVVAVSYAFFCCGLGHRRFSPSLAPAHLVYPSLRHCSPPRVRHIGGVIFHKAAKDDAPPARCSMRVYPMPRVAFLSLHLFRRIVCCIYFVSYARMSFGHLFTELLLREFGFVNT